MLSYILYEMLLKLSSHLIMKEHEGRQRTVICGLFAFSWETKFKGRNIGSFVALNGGAEQRIESLFAIAYFFLCP